MKSAPPPTELDNNGFPRKQITSWTAFTERLKGFEDKEWICRGQFGDWDLATTLQRCLSSWGIEPRRGPIIEHQLVREFRRRYRGYDRDEVRNDKLYCLALMQHHGAPTRLLDCTYSPFVAAHNAIKDGNNNHKRGHHVVWCFRGSWLDQKARNITGLPVYARNSDETRNDLTFTMLYETTPPKQFVLHDNPFLLNERLSIQQGLFLCPGDITVPFNENLKAMPGYDSSDNLLKLELHLSQEERAEFARQLKLMNISSAALFPGLDGFARSLGEQILHHEKIAIQLQSAPSIDEC